MRLILGCMAAVVVAAVAVAAIPRPDDDLLVVHEWGTFTSFSGSDGVHLEFRPLVDNDLPDFVFDRAEQAGVLKNIFGKKNILALQRMETPVVYFYTDREREVDVSVGFPQGLLTEFYPPVREMTPAFDLAESPRLTHSILDWGTVRLLPVAQFEAMRAASSGQETAIGLPETGEGDHYSAARETDSAIVEFEDSAGSHGKHYEKFLFYRGVGNFSLPLKLTSLGPDSYALTNSGADPVRSLFLVQVEGDRVRFARYEQIEGESEKTLTAPAEESTEDQLAEAVVESLVAEGLFEKEARAMVKTWRGSWFTEEGTRLLYVLPRRLTDKILPIQIEPRPDELVRVLVGRLEVLSTEQEQRIEKLVTGPLACKTAAVELAKLGRFAEPALERVRRKATSEDARRRAEELIHQIRRLR